MTRRRPTRTRLDPRTRRGQILDAAEVVLADRSPADLTFEAVAEHAGVSRALVYNYFGDRNGLLAAVELRLLDQLNHALHASFDASLTPVEQLWPLASAYVEFAHDHGPLWRILAVGGVEHPSVEAARRIRVERLATLWGGTAAAVVAARTASAMLESASIGWPDTGGDGQLATRIVCRMLADGLEAGLREATPVPLDQPHV